MNSTATTYRLPAPFRFSCWQLVGCLVVLSAISTSTHAAIPWDGDGNDGIWFNPANWNRNSNDNNTLPPGGDAAGTAAVTDTEISAGTASLNNGLGVIYDPRPGAPFIPVPDSVNDPPATHSYQHIAQLYISRDNTATTDLTPDNTLTIRGDLEADGPVVVGRSSGVAGTATNGKIIQEGGLFKIPLGNVDLGNAETGSRTGFGNGTFDYRGGMLEVSQDGGSGLRLAAGGSGGVGGIGRFIMRNPGPASPGYVRAYDINVAASEGNTIILANGTTNGVGIVEFHSAGTDGTRPIQVNRNLIINNGESGDAGAVRSSRLELILDAAPMVDGGGIPQNLGLFDVAFSDPAGSNTSGAGSLGDFFSSADGSTLYNQDAIVSAMFAGSTYNWMISYTGNITWADPNAGSVASISGTGGVDVVLIGHSSIIVPAGIAGDYNDDDVVDAADYVLWRENNGTNNVLPNDPIGGTIDVDQYNQWRANFGKTPASGSVLATGSAVPEPASALLAVASAFVLLGLSRRNRDRLQ